MSSRSPRSRFLRTLALAALGASLACSTPPLPVNASPTRAPSPEGEQAWRAQQPAAGAPRAFAYPAARVALLPNGVQVWLVPRKSATVALSVAIRGGGAASPAGKSGVAALTLRSMTEATLQKGPLELAEAAEALGTNLDFDTGRDGSGLSLEVLPSDVPAALGLLAEVITQPRFLPEDVTRVKRQWVDSLASERQDPARLASLAGMRALFGPVMGAPVRGSVSDVEHLTREDLVRFHRDYYVAPNLAVLAVGDLTLEQWTELVGHAFGHLPRKPAPVPAPAHAPTALAKTTVWIVDRPDSVQSSLFVGQPFPERAAPGFETRLVMNNLLGGLFTSRLNLNLREKHAYTYGVRSQTIATRHFGAFLGMTSVKTESTGDALEELLAELRGIATGQPTPIASDELDRSKTDLIHQLGANLEHARRILSDTHELFINALPADYQTTYLTRIANVTRAAAALEAARITPERLAIVIVGDRQKVAPLLAAHGITPLAAPAAFTE
jgi:zinc protease